VLLIIVKAFRFTKLDMRYFLPTAILFLFYNGTFAQLGQPQVFDFLNFAPSAAVTALGGKQAITSVTDSAAMLIPGVWLANPATNHSLTSPQVALSYQPYYADIDFATFTYNQPGEHQGNWGLGIQFLNYGSLESYDLTGIPVGTFSAQEYALVFNRSHRLGPFRMGLNAKYVSSQIAAYGASALLFDFGGTFIHPVHDLSVGMSLNNLGLFLNDYTSSDRSRLPTDLTLGLTFKPRYMPFRLYATGFYFLNQRDAYFSRDNNEKPGYVNKILRHVNLGGEILIGSKLSFLMGYNHLRANTLQLEQTRGGAGLSFGISLRLRFLQIDFSRTFFHAAGGISHFTLAAKLDKLIDLKRN
jgi:hypothetical protein